MKFIPKQDAEHLVCLLKDTHCPRLDGNFPDCPKCSIENWCDIIFNEDNGRILLQEYLREHASPEDLLEACI